MLNDNELVGAITIYNKEIRPFTDKQIELVKNFAAQAVIAIENTRLLNELRESLQQQTATADVLKVISSSPGELEPVFEAMLENAVRICGAKFGNLWLREGDAFRIGATHNTPQAYADFVLRRGLFQPDPRVGLGNIIRTKQPFQTADVAAVPTHGDKTREALIHLGGARTLIAVPMLKDNEVIGAIGIYRQEVQPFTNKQIELLENFAAQAVIAIENTRLLNELRESLQQQTATADVLKVISSSQGDLKPIFDSILINATRICEASFANLVLVEGDELRLGAMYGAPAAFAEALRLNPVVPRQTPVGRVIETKQRVHIADTQADEAYRYTRLAKQAGARTTLGVPMLNDDQIIGAILIYRQEVRPFTDKQIELVQNFASQAVIAVENTRLLNELRQRTDDLSESLEQQTATSDVLQVISKSSGELEPVFQAMLENAVRICAAKFGSLVLFEGNAYRRVALHNAPAVFVEAQAQEPVRPLATSPTLSRIAETKQIICYADILAEPPEEAIARLGGARAVLCVPMLKDDRAVGAISIYRQEVRPFSDKQMEVLTNFAAQAVIAIENTRLLKELRESLQQQTATADVLKVISRSTFNLETVFNTLLESAARLCEGHISWIFQSDGKILRWAASYGHTPEVHTRIREFFKPLEVPIDRSSVVGRAASEAAVVHIHDVLADLEYRWGEAQKIGGYRAAIGAPLLREGKVVGVLFVAKTVPQPFTEKQVELVKTFADQAVIAIENTRLLNELRESLQQQTATADVLKVISRSTFDLQTVLQTLVESAARLCDADKGNITREKDGVFYRAAASYGYSRQFVDHIKGIPLEPDRGSATGRALLEGRTIHIADVTTDPEYTLVEARKLGDYRTILCVPMLREGIALGVLTLTRSDVRPFTDKQIELVTTFADQAAIAIENVRLFESVEARTRELVKSLEDLRTTQDRLVQ
ncbi:MAG TPA: GAF domain-containing protein, partial [Blastocatellia bacterium]|nr:GAF domain-containing protein [Blastocatellia bacterium]